MNVIREMRFRYYVPTASGNYTQHAIVCLHHQLPELFGRVRKVNKAIADRNAASPWKEAPYKLAGVDERYREENDRAMELDEGWRTIINY